MKKNQDEIEYLMQEIESLNDRLTILDQQIIKINSSYWNKLDKCMDDNKVITDYLKQDNAFKKWLGKEIFK